MQIPQTHLKRVLEMSPDRYIHTRGVYRYSVLWRCLECSTFQVAKNKASIYAFTIRVLDFPLAEANFLNLAPTAWKSECKVNKKSVKYTSHGKLVLVFSEFFSTLEV